ncbi:rhamnogalacturonan acetylesterase [Paenibacillus ginsengarvi]|uniref:Rhamnogalacturonan acetylesterase n=1 Tax=Paenibacillus ginsengarvi TaxID=400777 RepID=A0A3B0CCL6_9BACL|nr:rhamnogalacturonan acetylesterase [Paenibacillus ginsengarvi]RKN84065.1 rhamnogalacturonan acetylesterase [Paenibacillus ginsengarvi]
MTTVYLAGDSTVSSYGASAAPMAGWGQMIGELFQDGVQVRNEARGGRSSKSFIGEGRLAPIAEAITPGDYLFIQFGHNDQKNDEARYTSPNETYPHYLRQYIEAARTKGATPVLFTPVERRLFGEDGRLKDSHGAYPAAVLKLADEENVTVIDLRQKSRSLLESLGDEASKKLFTWLEPGESPNYPSGTQDNTHFNETGAREIARLVAEGIRESGLALANRLLI